MELDPNVVHVAIRWLHVAAMATAFGGAVSVLALSTRPGAVSAGALVGVALRDRGGFLAAAGGVPVTGIGNPPAFGPGPLGPATSSGGALLLTLAAVLPLA